MLSLVVLASGRGSNLAALLAARDAGRLAVRFAGVLSDKPEATALQLAATHGVPAHVLRPGDFSDRAAFDDALFARVDALEPDLVVLAGYMRRIEARAIEPWRGRIINIHPALLPKYPGLHTHRRAIEAGDAWHGASVHFVSAILDGGPVISQVRVRVEPGDTEESLASRLLPLEHRLLVANVALIAQGRVTLGAHGVLLDGSALRTPLQLAEDGSLQGVG